MSKVNMIDGAGNAFTASLKRSRELVASGNATLADAPKKVPAKSAVKAGPRAPTKKVAAKAPAKKAAKKSGYSTRAMKASR